MWASLRWSTAAPAIARPAGGRWIFSICPATFRCSEARNRQKVDCGGKRSTFRMPVSIGSRSKNRRWFSRANPTYSASTIASTNWYTGMARVSRRVVSVSSTSDWNPSLSRMVAIGSRPPYAVRFLLVKSYDGEAAIVKGSALTAPAPGVTRVYSLSEALYVSAELAPQDDEPKRQV